ncbi:MAG: hypothetical protein PQJ58_11790 [Spirochaetales bacterium]|nr:hypothetical protein [Spirochaetales bacterium]
MKREMYPIQSRKRLKIWPPPWYTLRNKTEGRGMLETLGDRLMEKGKKLGRIEERNKIVKTLLESHVDIKIVSKSTGLSEEEIKKIAKI